MLLIKKFGDEVPEGKWFDFEIWGAEIGVQVRPRTEEVIKRIRNQNRTKRGKEWVYDEDAINDAVMDYLIEDFRGVGDEDSGKAWEITLENKKRLMAIPVPVGEQGIYLRVIDRANEQGFEVRADEIKN